MYKCKVSKFPENKNTLQSQRYFQCFLGRNSYILFAYVSINVIFAVNSWLTKFKPVVGTAIKWYLLAGVKYVIVSPKSFFLQNLELSPAEAHWQTLCPPVWCQNSFLILPVTWLRGGEGNMLELEAWIQNMTSVWNVSFQVFPTLKPTWNCYTEV